jgi:outer membrane protein, multidrug efflux system
MGKGFFLFVSLFILAGCMMGPNYKRPSVPTPSGWRVEEAKTSDLANTRWWEQFGDPALNSLIVDALTQNKDLRVAAARVEEFLGRYRSARASLFPTVAGGASGTRRAVTENSNPPPALTMDNPYNDFQAFLSAGWELDFWGRIRRATEAARAELLFTEEGRRAVVMTVVSAVATGYVDLRDMDKQLEIAEGTAKSREESCRLLKLRLDRGLISEMEMSQAESEYQLALAVIPVLQKQIARSENALSVLIGRNPGPIPRGKALDDLTLPAVPEGLPSQLLERRPDILQAEQSLIGANAAIGAAKALYFPTISLTGALGEESVDLTNLFTGPSRVWNYTASLAVPIFNSGDIAGKVKSAEAIQQQALFAYEGAIQQAFREVEDGLIDQRKSREQLAVEDRRVKALKEYARLARLRYDNGYTGYLEVLDAERSLFNAQLAFAETQGILFRALANLYKSMGGGWVAEADRMAH